VYTPKILIFVAPKQVGAWFEPKTVDKDQHGIDCHFYFDVKPHDATPLKPNSSTETIFFFFALLLQF
jgi:hypothetical protein